MIAEIFNYCKFLLKYYYYFITYIHFFPVKGTAFLKQGGFLFR
jgi:hypothetical protein